jgi:hypothetical protein
MTPTADGATVTIEVMNQGTGRGTPSCRLEALDAEGRLLRGAPMATGQVDGGATGTFDGRIGGLSRPPASVAVSCR